MKEQGNRGSKIMKGHQKSIGLNDEWLTPPELLLPLGEFDLDPCAPQVRPWATARRHIALPEDGLGAAWHGRVWCNPPFNRYVRPMWMRKMAEHGNGILLVPAATETEAFDLHVWHAATAVCFVRSRPHFCFVDGKRAAFNSGPAIALAAYGESNATILEVCGLGKTLRLK